MLTSVLDYISFAWIDQIFLVMGYYILTPSSFKWLNLNHFPSLCDWHSLSLPITATRFSVLITTGCFPSSLVYIIEEWSWFFLSLGGHLCLIFENGWQMKQIFVRMPNDRLMHIDSHLSAILFQRSPNLLSGDRQQILCDAHNELSNTHKIFIDSQFSDEYSGSCGKFRRSIKINDTLL